MDINNGTKVYEVGETIPVRFTNTLMPPGEARVSSQDGYFLAVEYVSGEFTGLRGLIRLPGWSR
jgi:hypothetical protein